MGEAGKAGAGVADGLGYPLSVGKLRGPSESMRRGIGMFHVEHRSG